MIPSSRPSVREACLPVNDDLSLISLDGKLFLGGKETFALTGHTGLEIPFPFAPNSDYYSEVSNFTVSPNHEMAAYVETRYQSKNGNVSYVDQSLKVLTDNGKVVEVHKWQPESEKLIEWFDNDRLLISLSDHSDGTVILLNPLTDERQEIKPIFSDIYNLDPIPWYQSPNPLPVYNSSMSFAFYLRNTVDGMEYVLNNQVSGKVVWTHSVHNPANKPVWSPNEDEVLIAIPQKSPSDFEFYSIDQRGKETKLSNFSSVYRFVYIGGVGWSPSAQYIGFWLDGRNNENESNPRFAILDLKTKQTTDFCIGPGGGAIFWSPNGNQIAFKVAEEDDPSLWHTVVVDIQKNIAVKLASQEYPIGWMQSR